MSADELEGIEIPDKLFYRIGEVASLVGVETHVLRYWESEFKMRPQRSPSGQRMYRRQDIARFLSKKHPTGNHDSGRQANHSGRAQVLRIITLAAAVAPREHGNADEHNRDSQ